MPQESTDSPATQEAPSAETTAEPTPIDQLGAAVEQRLEEWLPFYADAPLLQGLTILLLFLLLASLASVFLKRVVGRLLAKTKTDLDDIVLGALTSPIYVTMLAVGLRLALARIGLSDRPAQIVSSLLATVVIVAWATAAGRIVKALIVGASQTGRFGVLRTDTVPLFNNLSTIAIAVVAIYFLVVSWGWNISGLLALGGVGGLVIGLAAQDTIGNVFAGIFIFADSPYKVGDYINLDSGERGMVTDIGIRSTRLLTRDDVEITIPNSVIASAKIVNETGGPATRYRIRIPVGVAYGTDLNQVRDALEAIAAEEDLAMRDPAPRVRMRAFGASSIDFELLCWIEDPELRGKAKDALFMRVYGRFAELDIEIPYAKYDLYLKETPGGTSMPASSSGT